MSTLKMLVQQVALLAGRSLTRPTMSVKCEETSKKEMGGSQASLIKIYSYTNLQVLTSKKTAPLSPGKRPGSSTWEAGGSGTAGVWLPALLNWKTNVGR